MGGSSGSLGMEVPYEVQGKPRQEACGTSPQKLVILCKLHLYNDIIWKKANKTVSSTQHYSWRFHTAMGGTRGVRPNPTTLPRVRHCFSAFNTVGKLTQVHLKKAVKTEVMSQNLPKTNRTRIELWWHSYPWLACMTIITQKCCTIRCLLCIMPGFAYLRSDKRSLI